MSTTIDQRVVEMRFDNKQFEQNMSTTMSSLDKFKQSLNLTGATKGLEEVASASKRCDMSGISNAVETVRMRFSALEIMAITTLTNITNSAVNAGKRILSALTIDPVRAGFSEYELKMGSIQTMMAATGESLETVNGYLNELNEYSDKTIYSFSDMTQNIGKFTNAGVNLEDSVTAIKGIANVAAVSGANSNEASRAMYNFSQALSSGYVKLIDWKSIELANMGTVEFKQQLLDAAAAAGTLTKTGDGMYKTVDGKLVSATKNFNDSLQDQWMTSEVLINTLKQYTDESTEIGKKATKAATEVKTLSQLFDTLKESAQSGWAQSWEIIVGDFEEAKQLMTELSDIFGGLIGKQAESRNELLENWKTLGGRTALLDSVRNALEAIGSIAKPIGEAFREIFPPMTAERLLALTEGLKSFTESLKLSDGTADKLKRTFKGIFAILGIVKQAFSAVFEAVGSLMGGVGELGGGILDITAGFGDWLVKLHDFIESSGIFNRILSGVVAVVGAALKCLKTFVGFINKKVTAPGLEVMGSVLDKIKDKLSILGDVASVMKDGIISAFDATGSFLEQCTLFKVLDIVWKAIKTIASGIAKAFGALTKGLINIFSGADFNEAIDILTSLFTGGIVIKVIQFLKGIMGPLEDVKDFFGDFLGGITGVLEDVQGRLKAGTLKTIATAIAILAASLLVLSFIDAEGLARATGAITALFVELSIALAVINGMTKQKGLFAATSALKGIATAMLILSVAMKILSTMSVEDMLVAFAGIAGGLTALVIAINLLPEKKVKSAASSMKKMATALLILSLALKIMGSMSWSQMAVGLTTMSISLAALVGALHLLPKDTGVKTLGLISFATAMVILAGALKIMGTMSWEEMAISLVTLGGALAIMSGALHLMKGAIGGALAMFIVAPALLLLAASLKILSTMSLAEMGIGLVALGGSLLLLAAGLNLMTSAIPGALALMVASAALAVLAPVILLLGTVSWQTVAQGLLTIAGAFLVIGVAGLVLSPIVPAILALAGAMALIGIGTLAAGAGLILFGTGLTALAVGFTALVGSLGAVVSGIIAIVSSVITGILKGIGDGIVAFCKVITDGAPAIGEAAKVLIVSMCDAIVESVPSIIEAISVLLSALLDFIVDFVPELVVAGIKLIVGLLKGIAANIGSVISAAVDVVLAFIKGVASQIPKIIQAGIDLMLDFITGMADGIRKNTRKVLDAVNDLMSSVFEAIGMAIGNVPVLGKQIIQGLIKGIKSSAGDLLDSIVGVVKKAWNGVLDFLGIASPSKLAAEAGRFVDEGFAVGLKTYAKTVGKSAIGVGETAMNSLKEAVGNISDIIDIDDQPSIRPVLDLSAVEQGARDLGRMFSDKSNIGVISNLGAINSAMTHKSQNGESGATNNSNNVTNNTYIIDGVTYDDGSNVANAVEEIVHAATVERRM